MAVFCHQTLSRFSCVNELKMSQLSYSTDYFEARINFSKTDQKGDGQIVILPSINGAFNPHMLMCLYINVISESAPDLETVYVFPPLV